MPQNSTQGMQPNLVASGIFVRRKKWKNENTGHLVFQGASSVGRGILMKRNDRDTIHFDGEYGNIDLLYKD